MGRLRFSGFAREQLRTGNVNEAFAVGREDGAAIANAALMQARYNVKFDDGGVYALRNERMM